MKCVRRYAKVGTDLDARIPPEARDEEPALASRTKRIC